MPTPTEQKDLPAFISRYRVIDRIAVAGFGTVLRARDDDLDRDVAIKVPHPHLVATEQAVEAFLAEARILASLDHPGIVSIYDVGCTEDGIYFLVAKLIEGTNLSVRLQKSRPSQSETVEIVARVAEALHCAHLRGLVHRDVKLANILLDPSGRPILVDFGLALKDEDVGSGPICAGTPGYLSPEQARGEGHLVDRRSDVYSLGVAFYELLVGRRPFKADSLKELLQQIVNVEPRPPRQFDERIPRELERICLKAMSKRASDRHSTAQEMADDLWHVLNAPTETESRTIEATSVVLAAPHGPTIAARIVPRGLRSFRSEDADFFLDLLPGPRNRDGLPESIAFWKTRLEATDPDRACRVGVVYGPSGCGKSSLVRAGLLPRLAQRVRTVYVEATAEQTETRLLGALRRLEPEALANVELTQAVQLLRRKGEANPGTKIVVVLDQFEQWLHVRGAENTTLTEALRQCDGVHVQCLLMVRDDFWLDLSRFMRELEVPLVEGENTYLVDRFDVPHARAVLAEFGRAFGCLPDPSTPFSPEQQRFLDQAIEGLADKGKIIPVQLSLFAEMVKGKSWSDVTLRTLGGTEGIGVAFLEETFSAPSAPAKHRLHEQAARSILKALLPEQGSDIKGKMRSLEELREASGCDEESFAAVMRTLDQELRMVTPTSLDGQGSTSGESDLKGSQRTTRAYQLTHDYLVPALRRWLTHKQRETRRGRAELRLAECAAEWKTQPASRYLPTWWDWLSVHLWVRRSQWSPVERTMMDAANRYYGLRNAAWFLVVLLLGAIGIWVRLGIVEERKQAQALRIVESITNFHGSRMSQFQAEMQADPVALPMLKAWVANPNTRSPDRTHARMVLLPFDSEQLQPLMETMLVEGPEALLDVREALEPYGRDLSAELWRRYGDAHSEPSVRLSAAAALAAFDPGSTRWGAAAGAVTAQLLEEGDISEFDAWLRAFAPARQVLLTPLMERFLDVKRPEKQRLATEALARYAADQPEVLVDLMLQANPAQYRRLWPVFEPHRATVTTRLHREYHSTPPGNRDAVNKRRAQALVTLLRLGDPRDVWPLLQHSSDPELRSFLVHLFGPLGADPWVLCARYEQENDVSVRRALLLSIGSFDVEQVPSDLRKTWTPRLLATFRDHPDPGLHAAAEWLLRRWGQEKEFARLLPGLVSKTPLEQRRWFVNGQGQTRVILAAPGEIVVGSPPQEVGHRDDETRRRVYLGKPFAVATTNVTYEQFQKFLKAHPEVRHNHSQEYAPAATCPVLNVTWYQSAQYCRWLSEQEGVPEEQTCYPPVAEIKDGMTLPADLLERTGYRLPTEAEWEYACRAGSDTSRCYGSSETLLQHYAWYLGNAEDHAWPVGLRKPNDFGLFDVHGNAWTWCHDRFVAQPTAEDKFVGLVDSTKHHVLRGGSFRRRPFLIRSACRLPELPVVETHEGGLRVVRTLPSRETPPSVAVLKPEAQIKAIAAQLNARNPGFNGELQPTFDAGKTRLIRLKIDAEALADLSPLQALTGLQHLGLSRSPKERIVDTPATPLDLRQLVGLPITYLSLEGYSVADLTPLKRLPLESLLLRYAPATDLTPLAEKSSLTLLDLWGSEVMDLRPVHRLRLSHANVGGRNVSDLSALKGMPLKYLCLNGSQVRSLAVVGELKDLTILEATRLAVDDLAPLKGLALTRVHVAETEVTDVTPLEGMPLEILEFTPERVVKGVEILRKMRTLKTINGLPSEQFWEKYDAGAFRKKP